MGGRIRQRSEKTALESPDPPPPSSCEFLRAFNELFASFVECQINVLWSLFGAELATNFQSRFVDVATPPHEINVRQAPDECSTRVLQN